MTSAPEGAPRTDRLRRFWSRWRTTILLGALALALVLGVRASLSRLGTLEDAQIPSHPAMAIAVVLLLAGQLVLGYGWRRLVPTLADPVHSMWTFHASQPGKYLPLGVGQALGQVALAREAGMPARQAMAGWASHTLMIVAAGITVGSLVVINPDLGPWRYLAAGGLLAIASTRRPVLARIVGAGARFTSRLPAAADLPGQRALTEAYLSAVAFMVLDGLAFAVLLDGFRNGPGSVIGLVGAYGMAMGLSIVTPLPAGLGIREAILVLLSGVGAAPTIAAAVVIRVSTFGVEVAMLTGFSIMHRLRLGSAGAAGPSASPEAATPGSSPSTEP